MTTDTELERLERDARRAARPGSPTAVFNLNRVGRRLLVIRSADAFPGEDRMVAGPFHADQETG